MRSFLLVSVLPPEPDWAAYVTEVLAKTPEKPPQRQSWPPPPVTTLPNGTDDSVALDPSLDGFAVPLRPFVDHARDEIVRGAANLANLDLDAVCDQFADELSQQLVTIAARTLVLELNVARVSGRLTGDTGRERFTDFLRQLAGRAGLTALFAEYPVLAQLLAQSCRHAVDARLEQLHRFAADRDAIVGTLLGGTDPGQLRSVDGHRGDRHQRGRAVAIMRFADGRSVVYKPRSQAFQHHFGDFVGFLNAKVPGLGLWAPSTLPRPGYGWVEFVERRPCADRIEVDRFYRRQGTLLALLYAIDATDIHYENLIAAGDQPVLVDVETLFHPTLDAATTIGPDPAQRVLRSSVSRTALLPYLIVGEHGAADLSGLGGDRGTTFPFDSVSWDASGTDEMRLVRRPAEVRGGANRPRLAGRDVDPADYRRALLTGFRAGYDAIVAHRDELLGLVDRCTTDDIRVVIRPTRAYATLLDEATHPDVLRAAADRDALFEVLSADSAHNPIAQRVVPFELADLWAGDVPLFTSRPGSRDLWTAVGERVPDLLPRPTLDAVTAKIMGMDEVDRLDQEWLITAAFAARTGRADHRGGHLAPSPAASSVPDPRRLLAAACGIADQIIGTSRQDERRANWLGLEQVDGRHWAILPMGAGLGDGYCGVALFLAQLSQLTGSSRYRDLARKAVTPIPWLFDSFTADRDLASIVGPGAFTGIGGICYTLARLGTLLDDAEIRSWLPRGVELMSALDEGSAGIATGQAGGLLAMLAVHAETGMAPAAEAAHVIAGRLADARPDPAGEPLPVTGFAGGPAGIAHAMRRYAASGLAQRPARQATKPMLVADTDGWCGGRSGLLVAAADLLAEPLDAAFHQDIDHAVAALDERRPLRDLSLCHGELGVAEGLTVLVRHGHDAAERAAVRYAARVLGALDRDGPLCGTPGEVTSPGLLTGLAGIGYGLLRLGFADRVPSVLSLEPEFKPAAPNVSIGNDD